MDEQHQEQQPQQQRTTPRITDPELTKWQASNAQEIIELEEDLRGERYDPRDGKWKTMPNAPKMMNDQGVRATISWVRSLTNKNIVLSDFDEKEIIYMLDEIASRFNDFLFLNIDTFQLKDEYYSYINGKVFAVINAAYIRAKDAGEAKRLSERTEETYVQQPEQKKKTFRIF
jgi:hypothetical protein